MHIPILTDLFLVFFIAVGVVVISHRLHIPSLLGFLITGMVAGPHGLQLIHSIHEVEILAEIGVMLLLFTIGLEFSFARLLEIRRTVLIGGGVQVVGTAVVAGLLVRLAGWSWSSAVFMGCLLSLSSTAIVLKLFQDRGEMETPAGRSVLGILIFQDLMVAPMILLAPALSGQMADPAAYLWDFLLKMTGLGLFVWFAAHWATPRLLTRVARTRNREVFLLSVLAICLGVAGLTASAGLSMALGAFLAGLVISESPYGLQALSSVLPFRDVFTCLFFVSIGMLLDAAFVLDHALAIVLLSMAVIVVKALLAGVATKALGESLGVSLLVGLSMAQVGEFGFVLSRAGVEAGLLEGDRYQFFLAFSVITMAAAPFLIQGGGLLARRIQRRAPNPLEGLCTPPEGADKKLRDHVIIAGFGPSGRMLSRGLRAAGIPYLVVETNPETVRRERSQGESIFYGDATQDEVLRHAGVDAARSLIVTVPNPAAALEIVHAARLLNPGLHILARTPFLEQMDELERAGANDVAPVDQEMAVVLLERLLARYLVPREEVERLTATARENQYGVLLKERVADVPRWDLTRMEMALSTVLADADSPLVGKSLQELRLRRRHEVTVLAVRRDQDLIAHPEGEFRIALGDQLMMMGRPENVRAAAGGGA